MRYLNSGSDTLVGYYLWCCIPLSGVKSIDAGFIDAGLFVAEEATRDAAEKNASEKSASGSQRQVGTSLSGCAT